MNLLVVFTVRTMLKRKFTHYRISSSGWLMGETHLREKHSCPFWAVRQVWSQGYPVCPSGEEHLSLFTLWQLENWDPHLWPTGNQCIEPYGVHFVLESVIWLDFLIVVWTWFPHPIWFLKLEFSMLMYSVSCIIPQLKALCWLLISLRVKAQSVLGW